MKVLLTALLLTLGAFAADVTQQINERERAWAAAVQGGDVATLDKLYTDDLIYAHSTGNVDNKKSYLDRMKTGAQKYDRVVHEKIAVVPHGDAVVTHSFARMSGTSNGKPFDDHLMILHLWVKQNGVWKIAAHQTTKLAQ
jgi:ketosteroid isomerase-like protein